MHVFLPEIVRVKYDWVLVPVREIFETLKLQLASSLTSLSPATLLKKESLEFPVNFVKFLRTPFLQNTSGQLLSNLITTVKPPNSGHAMNSGQNVKPQT